MFIPFVTRLIGIHKSTVVKLARPERFELPTTWFEARYSIQLSYGRLAIYSSRSTKHKYLKVTILRV